MLRAFKILGLYQIVPKLKICEFSEYREPSANTSERKRKREKEAEGEEEGESKVKTPINSHLLGTAMIENDLRSFKMSVFQWKM